ncbi:DUF202 domain-containing protein [Microbacterium sp. ZW CA_36]|uniref:DUF202 domain-containing protein n=1 Tax=Microbacterium sp. ZW CA_36 TaxID=3378078 RepID=UPI0038556191
MNELFDPGLQPERNELAWRRTALALGVGSIVAMRLIPSALGNGWWVLVGAAGLAVSAFFWLSARRRYRAVNVALRREGERAGMPGASRMLALAIFTSCAGALSLTIAIAVAVSPT